MYVTIVQFLLQALNKRCSVFWLLVAEWWLNTINTSTINTSYRYYTCPYKLTCPATLNQLVLSCHAWSRVHAFYVLILWQYWHSYRHHTLHAISTPTQCIPNQIMSLSKSFRAVLGYGKLSSCHSRYSGKSVT